MNPNAPICRVFLSQGVTKCVGKNVYAGSVGTSLPTSGTFIYSYNISQLAKTSLTRFFGLIFVGQHCVESLNVAIKVWENSYFKERALLHTNGDKGKRRAVLW